MYCGPDKTKFVIYLAIALTACSSPPPVENAALGDDNLMSEATAAMANLDAAMAEENLTIAATPPDTSGWVYSVSKDQLTGKEIKTACVTSDNQVKLDFPYENTTARLCVRQHPQWGRDVYFSLDDDGQILCNSSDGCNLEVRFGDGEVTRYSATEPEDNSTNMVFLADGDSDDFLANVRKAKETAIQVPFYQAGSQTLLFKTADLKWAASAD